MKVKVGREEEEDSGDSDSGTLCWEAGSPVLFLVPSMSGPAPEAAGRTPVVELLLCTLLMSANWRAASVAWTLGL